MATEEITREDIDALVPGVGEAADAYIRGDLDTYLRLIHHADDYTLMSPFGVTWCTGSTRHLSSSPRRRSTSAPARPSRRWWRLYTSGDLVVSERDRAAAPSRRTPATRTGPCGVPVFRRPGSQWQQVHRHADALVHPWTSTSCRCSPAGEPAQPRGRTRSTASVPPPLEVVTSRSPSARLVTERSRP